MAFEPIVRNFETPAPLSTDRIIQEVTKIPAQRARLRWGAVGKLPPYSTAGFTTAGSHKYKEKTRNVTKTKVTNPDDPTQYVIIESAATAFFAKVDPDTITVGFGRSYVLYGPPALKEALAPGFTIKFADDTNPQNEFDFLPPGDAGLHFNK